MSTHTPEPHELWSEVQHLREVNAALLEALEAISDCDHGPNGEIIVSRVTMEKVRAAIALAKGGRE